MLGKLSCRNSIEKILSYGKTKVAKASSWKVVLWKDSLKDRSYEIEITEFTEEILGHVAKFGSSNYEFKKLAENG